MRDLLLFIPALMLVSPVLFYGFVGLSGLLPAGFWGLWGAVMLGTFTLVPLLWLSGLGYGWLLLAAVFRRGRRRDTLGWALAISMLVLSAAIAYVSLRLAGSAKIVDLSALVRMNLGKRLVVVGVSGCLGALSVVVSLVLRQRGLRREPDSAPTQAASKRHHPGWWALAILLVILLAFGGGVGAIRYGSYKAHEDSLQAVRTELATDFPGFETTRFDYQDNSADMGFDSSPYSTVRFEVRLRGDHRLRLVGTYFLKGYGAGAPGRLRAFRETIFNGKQYSPGQIADFARAWASVYPTQAIQVGESLTDSREYFNARMTGRLAKRFDLDALYGLVPVPDERNDRAAWFYFDASKGMWISAGSSPALIHKYGP